MADTSELTTEQEYFDRAQEYRERKRRDLIAAPDSAAGPRAAVAELRRGIEGQLEQVGHSDDPIAFGRIDAEDGTYYIGRHLITDDQREPVVINWKLPLAERFYRCSFQEPLGVKVKRQFKTVKNTVLDFDELVLQDIADRVEALTRTEEIGVDDAVLRELDADRTGEMQDIVQTIHAAQYELIRASLDQLLIIQGGPGTGKTVVALHRVSWLLFNYANVLRADKVLVIGPNPTFSRYISSVLPGLGDTNVPHLDLRSLGPQTSGLRENDLNTARLKGEERMSAMLARGLHQRIRIADSSDTFDVGGANGARLQREKVEIALENASSASSYNVGRAQFRSWLESRARSNAVNADAVTPVTLDNALERAWPQLTPQAFLRDLLGSRDRLVAAAGDDFTAGDIARLSRQAAARLSEERWTESDIALLDEADELINGSGRKYDHIVVDEAQDLSPMQLRSVARRSSNGSMTVVGDLAQATGPWASDSWDDTAEALMTTIPCVREELLLGYRVPEQVYSFAKQLLPFAAPGISAPRIVRTGPDDPELIEVGPEDLAERAIEAATQHASRGRFVGVICPDSLRGEVIEELARQEVQFADARSGRLGTSINLADPDESKGLEFDAVVVVSPEAIAADDPRGLRKLYVSLTRTTRYLTVIHTGDPMPIPRDQEAGPATPPAPDDAPDSDLRQLEAPEHADTSTDAGGPDDAFLTPRAGEPSSARPAKSRFADAVVAMVAEALAQDLRESAAPTLWPAVLEQMRRDLGLPH